MIGRRVGGRRWRRLGRNAELGIVAQQRVVVALLEVVCESVEKVEELSDGLGVEIVGQPVWVFPASQRCQTAPSSVARTRLVRMTG